MKLGNFGQALVEFACFSIFSIGLLGIIGKILSEEWHRSKCAYLVFEGVHRYRAGNEISSQMNWIKDFKIRFENQQNKIIGVGQCGEHIETVELPKLGHAQW